MRPPRLWDLTAGRGSAPAPALGFDGGPGECARLPHCPRGGQGVIEHDIPHSDQKGSLLVVTLWLIITLSLAAIALFGYLATETRLMRYHVARAQAKAWAKAGVSLALQRLAQDANEPDGNAYDWLGDDWAYFPQQEPEGDPTVWVVQVPLGSTEASRVNGQVAIQVLDEERRLNLNAADQDTLARFLGNPDVAKAIVDYRSPEDEGIDTTVQPPYLPKNAEIRVLEELWDIPRVSADSVAPQRVRAQGTVSTQGALNVNTATPDVLTAVAGEQSAGIISALVAIRPGNDGQLGTPDDCKITRLNPAVFEPEICDDQLDQAALAGLLSLPHLVVASSVFRIRIDAQMEKPPVHYRLEAIVHRGNPQGTSDSTLEISGESFQILRWQEG